MITSEDYRKIIKEEKDFPNVRRDIRSISMTYGFNSKEISNIIRTAKELISFIFQHSSMLNVVRITKWKDSSSRNIGMQFVVEEYGIDINSLESFRSENDLTFKILEEQSDEFYLEKINSPNNGILYKMHFLRNRNLANVKSRKLRNDETRIEFNQKSTQSYQWSIFGDSLPRIGELRNGDKVSWFETDDFILGLVIDGVGHGYQADLASSKAKDLIENNLLEPLENLVRFVHLGLSNTVGAQLFIIRIDKQNQIAEYVGIGNIRSYVIRHFTKIEELVSKDGTLGYFFPNYLISKFFFNEITTIIIHSDGISKKWLEEARTINANMNSPQIQARILLDKYRKMDDDSSVLIIQNKL